MQGDMQLLTNKYTMVAIGTSAPLIKLLQETTLCCLDDERQWESLA
jgi:hypothetical protein